ncbi:GNAT family N-acetyltransferase [Methylophaga sp. OBS4]|uniref:GNAT family N-acetyltransferase n=1 Tax=Methylophaga sp. OBS4 TaxID=2991935 RepID=UPI0022587555|nr:GNAT family N-acetyltransferase [Methylophaga sp. OBS4]MCX4186967.1 GNAT family N-acetyltransferase [Methylophaga sp. OBS4]
MNPIIRKALHSDIPALTRLLLSCAESMSQQNMHHWQGVYDEEQVLENMKNKQVFILERDQQVLGCIALGREKADYYDDCWPDAPDADFYITQLAVNPGCQGQGYGKLLMQHCVNQVGQASLQLDAVDHYPALLRFYQQLGFTIIATGIGLGDKRHLFELQTLAVSAQLGI